MTWVETETVIELQPGIVAIEVYLQFENVQFPCKKNRFPFLIATAKSIGDVWMNRQSGVKMFLSVTTAHLIDFLNRRCHVNR
jgi:hypothetical protein